MTVGGGARREPRCRDCEHEPEYGEALSPDGKDWCYDCGFTRFKAKNLAPEEKKEPNDGAYEND